MRIFNKIINIALIVLVFLGGMFVNIDFSPSTGLLDLGIEISQAEANTGTTATNTTTPQSTEKNTYQWIIDALNDILGIIMVIVSPIVLLAWWLMSPDWVTGDIFGLREKMYGLWVTVSNILYFVYAIMLIVIAIATIFNYQPYAYKSMLPRLFIGILLIPTTWWFVQFMISTATIVTGTVLKIPQEMMAKMESKGMWETASIPRTIQLSSDEKHNEGQLKKCSMVWPQSEWTCISPKDIMASGLGIYSPIFVYAYGIFEIQNLKDLPDGNSIADVIKTIWDLTGKLVFNTILFLIFGLLTIALVFILFIRAVKLWMYAIFSPIFTAKVVFKDWKWEWSDMFDIKEFIGLAFVPAVIGLALSFGLIVVASIQDGLSTPPNKTWCDMTANPCTLLTIGGNPKNTITTAIKWKEGATMEKANDGTTATEWISVTTVNFWDLSFEYKWSLKAWAPTKIEQGNFLWGFGTVIVQVIALIFIWVAFIAAAKINKWVQAVVEPFEKFWKGVAEMGKTSLKWIPMPLVGNVHWMERAISMYQTNKQTSLENKFARSSIGQAFGTEVRDPVTENKITNAVNSLKITDSSTVVNNITAGSTLRAKDHIVNRSDYTDRWKGEALKRMLTQQIGENATNTQIKALLRHWYWLSETDANHFVGSRDGRNFNSYINWLTAENLLDRLTGGQIPNQDSPENPTPPQDQDPNQPEAPNSPQNPPSPNPNWPWNNN